MATGLTPVTRREMYLSAAAGETETSVLPTPVTREEIYLNEIAQGGGGSGGTTDYDDLENKPSINNVILSDNKTLSEIGAASATDLERLNGIEETDDDYIEMKSGVRLYITDTAPTGNIPDGSVGVGW